MSEGSQSYKDAADVSYPISDIIKFGTLSIRLSPFLSKFSWTSVIFKYILNITRIQKIYSALFSQSFECK